MTPPADWGDSNRRFTAAAVGWVRAKLERAAALARAAASRPPKKTWWCCRPRPARPSAARERAVDDAAARMNLYRSGPHRPALEAIRVEFGLTGFEFNLLLLCAAADLDGGVDALCAELNGGRRYPTLGTAMGLFGEAGGDAPPHPFAALDPGSALEAGGLVQVAHADGGGLLTAAVRLHPRVRGYVLRAAEQLGDGAALDPTLEGYGGLLPEPPDDGSDTGPEARLAAVWAPADGGPFRPAHLTGPDEERKAAVAARAGRRTWLRVFRLAADRLPDKAADLDVVVRAWERERRLFPLALYLEVDDAVPGPGGPADGPGLVGPAARFLARVGGPVAAAADPGLRTEAPAERIDVPRPTIREQAREWAAALVLPTFDCWRTTHPYPPGRLAAQFDLDGSAVRAVGAAAVDAAGDRPAPLTPKYVDCLFDEAWQRCATATRPRVDDLAQRLVPPARWTRRPAGSAPRWDTLGLYLPTDVTGPLDELVAQVNNRWRVYDELGLRAHLGRGLGIAALFTGESGTGKTTTAEAVAFTLGLDVYRVDLSAVMDKYIGETEKKLRRVFDAFEPGGAVLFFDECDALFGKRTEVKDGRDRYANVEVSYLLQRLETYRGLAVLATNNPAEVDTAFVRRLRFVVPFGRPAAPHREAIWRHFLLAAPKGVADRGPKACGLTDRELEAFATLDMNGGAIQSAATRALFLAARKCEPVGWDHALAAAKGEFEKRRVPFPRLERPRPPRPVKAGGVA